MPIGKIPILLATWLRAFLLSWWAAFGGLVVALAWACQERWRDSLPRMDVPVVTTGAVLFAFAAASFKSWADEHVRLNEERSRNNRPELTGEFYDVQITAMDGGMVNCRLSIKISNMRPQPTNLDSVFVVLSDEAGNTARKSLDVSAGGNGMELPQGMVRSLSGSASVMLNKPHRLRVVAKDGFGVEHQIPSIAAVPGVEVDLRSQLGITIHKALWGTGHRWRYKNVTNDLKGWLITNKVVRASNRNFGDLFPGLDRHLKVEFSYAGDKKRYWVLFEQGHEIIFPPLPVPRNEWAGLGKLQ